MTSNSEPTTLGDALPYPDLAALIAFYGDGNFVSGAKITIPYGATRVQLERLAKLEAVEEIRKRGVEIERLCAIENAALRVASSRRGDAVRDARALDELDKALEARAKLFERRPIECKHERATLKCPDCGIDMTGQWRPATPEPQTQELVTRLRARGHVGGPTEPISVLLALAADMIERLGGKLRRINAINDSPATFNREIDRLTSCSNFIAPDEYCERVIGHEGACGYEPAPTAAVATGTERFNIPGVLRMLEAEAAAAFTGERTKIELVARLIRQQQEEIERLTSVADAEMKLREGNFAQIERLQRALSFWLPGVPADDPEVAQRAGDDAHLLAGVPVSGEPDAEDLGWISLREAP